MEKAKKYIKKISEIEKMPMIALTGKKRDRETSDIRFLIYAVLYFELNLTTSEIGNIFNRDRSSVSYGLKQVTIIKELRDRYCAISEKLKNYYHEQER